MSDSDIVERTGGLKRPSYWTPFGDFACHDWDTLTFSADDLATVTGTPETSQWLLSLLLDLGVIRSVGAQHG